MNYATSMLGLKGKTILGLSTPSTFLRFCFCADTDDADTDDSRAICFGKSA